VTTRRLWAGRTTALLGILLVALSLRSAVAAISPIVAEIGTEIELTSVGLGVIGALPPVFFALGGLVAPPLAHRLGLERVVLLAAVAMVLGHVARATAGSYTALLLGSAATLAATGIANVLLPPLVKRYFPDRVGLVTATYATVMTISSALPALTAAPIADSAGWRVSLGVWAITAGIAAVPWVVVLVRQRRASAAGDAAPELVEPPPALAGRLAHSRVAWAIAITFMATSLNVYAMFAWLPILLVDIAGVTPIVAGSLLSLYSFIAIPGSIAAPLLVARMRKPGWIIQGGVVLFVLGYAGLLLAPASAPWLWVALIGAGPILFPVCLVLINVRTRSQRTSAALSGFAQGIGYGFGALGPLVVGVLHESTGGWSVPIVFLTAVALLAVPFGVVLSHPRTVEEDLEQRAKRRRDSGRG
jgi:CP family cyanate transporter-like MFS transporter